MYRLGHLLVLILAIATGWQATVQAQPRNPSPTSKVSQDAQPNGPTTIRLRWGARTGVFRYRLQLATDRAFHDILFDRVVNGTEYQITDLAPGRYFWRVAPITNKLGEFSSATSIEVTSQASKPGSDPEVQSQSNRAQKSTPSSNAVVAGGGWRAAVGEVTQPVLAHLRSRDRFDLAAVNADGVTFALDANSGISLWSSRRATPDVKTRSGVNRIPPLTIGLASGLEDVIVISGVVVTRLDGATGREIWQSRLPSIAQTAAVLAEKGESRLFVVDNSLQMLFVVDGKGGSILSQSKLARRLTGSPVAFVDRGLARMMFAFDNGRVEVRDNAGALIRYGEAGSPATTSPLFVNGPRGDLVLIGTRSGLTALNAEDLRALGRVSFNGDAPRGALAAADLNADGVFEVISVTDRGRVEVVNAADGKLLWESKAGSDAETAAFADIDSDGWLDVLMAGGQAFAMAFSGRDGSVIWQDSEAPISVANHAVSLGSRRVVTVRSNGGVLLIAGDSSRTGLRGLEFPLRSRKL
ncbi:MAG: PQQ-binding-like beta-propeller repeat protein [Acidobacteriota bacterium]